MVQERTGATKRVEDPALDLSRYPDGLRKAEARCLAQRKGLDPDEAEGDLSPWKGKVGLALSGGGIRSATFSLGILQALAAPLKQEPSRLLAIDILSTVSGGGYIGSFLGGLFLARKAEDGGHKSQEMGEPREKADQVLDGLRDPHGAPLRFLRENGRYLTPGGSGDFMRAAAVAIRNFVALHIVMGVFALLWFLCLDLVLALVIGHCSLQRSYGLWGVELSGWILLPGLAAALVAIPAGWAYWLAGDSGSWKPFRLPAWTTVLALGLAGSTLGYLSWTGFVTTVLGPWTTGLCIFVAIEAFLAFLWLAFDWGTRILTSRSKQADEQAELSPRRRLTSVLRWGLFLILGGLYLTLVDTLALALYGVHTRNTALSVSSMIGTAVAVLGVLASKTQSIRTFLATKVQESPQGRIRVPWSLLAGVLAFLLATIILAFLAYLAHGLGSGWTSLGEESIGRLWPLILVTLVLSVAFGRTFSFLNQSTLGPFYTEMLTRAYLGASNGVRNTGAESAPYVVDGDDLSWRDYRPHEHGGPLHLINVCLNETTGGESQVTQRDRRGMAMAVGPAGVSVGVRHHALWENPLPKGGSKAYGVFQVNRDETFNPEQLTVGQWMGISGAAVGTGMGHAGNRGLSFLFGILNARLGHWWDSGIRPRYRALRLSKRLLVRPFRTAFSVQLHILDEYLGLFPGTSTQQWPLSDGGHFENLGIHELIRRRVPFVIAVDAGADPKSDLGDLENLVRLARVDLDADVHFLSAGELQSFAKDQDGKDSPLKPFVEVVDGQAILGPLDWLRRGDWEGEKLAKEGCEGFSRCHASLARVTYREATTGGSWILYIKPTLLKASQARDGLPLDVRNYHEHHPEFPHEGTQNQFYNEAQWESYRRLGEYIGRQLFTGAHLNVDPIWKFCSKEPQS